MQLAGVVMVVWVSGSTRTCSKGTVDVEARVRVGQERLLSLQIVLDIDMRVLSAVSCKHRVHGQSPRTMFGYNSGSAVTGSQVEVVVVRLQVRRAQSWADVSSSGLSRVGKVGWCD